jgi:hypothetical protein
MIDSTSWQGPLTRENVEDVAAAIKERLEGMTYTFIRRDEGFRVERREGQELAPWSSRDGKNAVFVDQEERYASFTVVDTWGVWGASTDSEAHVAFDETSIFLDLNAPAGNRLHWEIVIEGPKKEEE